MQTQLISLLLATATALSANGKSASAESVADSVAFAQNSFRRGSATVGLVRRCGGWEVRQRSLLRSVWDGGDCSSEESRSPSTSAANSVGDNCNVDEDRGSFSRSPSCRTNSSGLLVPRSSASSDRRAFLLSAAIASVSVSGSADAFSLPFFGGGLDSGRRNSGLLLNSREGASSIQAIVGADGDAALSAERCLLRLLPVKNPVFLALEAEVERVSILKSGDSDDVIPDSAWKTASATAANALRLLDNKRDRLQPVFNQDLDSTEMQIRRAQRGEELIEDLRTEIVMLVNATSGASEAAALHGGVEPASSTPARVKKSLQRNATAAFEAQKAALLALAGVGELLVNQFPYDVPSKGKYSFLPRLLGRARVTFSLKRGSENGPFLGNVTIIADGFAAPITAGNFVDLCVRGFYTGLPIKSFQKRLGSPAMMADYDDAGGVVGSALANLESKLRLRVDQDEGMADIGPVGPAMTTFLPVWGSFNEGFYDPLTAKPRRIPLEIVEIDRTKPGGGAKLTYAGGLSDSTFSASAALPVLTFDIPGLLAMNHPDRYPNGGSSEFFVLPQSSIAPEKTKLLDRRYAPFGYVIKGFDLLEKLKAGDVIAGTDVSQWGKLNLVKVRSTSFGEIIQGSGKDEETGEDDEQQEAGSK